MKIPDFLRPGDKVAIVCPASFLRGDISMGISILESWGLEVLTGETVTSQYHQFAGDDQLRAKDFQWAIDQPEVKAIFAARGGYGSVRIIDEIDFTSFLIKPKWVIGFSDITVFHAHLNQLYQVPTLHAQMPKSFETGSKESLETLRTALFGEKLSYTYTSDNLYQRHGKAKGKLIGGNLAILHSILASESEPSYKNKILFIEDIGESYYTVDRMLWALKRAGRLKNLSGLIVGGFTGMKDGDPSFGQTIEEIIMDKVAEYDYPVIFDFPAGHIDDNRALFLGRKIKLKASEEHNHISFI